jgi:hypothetical protein
MKPFLKKLETNMMKQEMYEAAIHLRNNGKYKKSNKLFMQLVPNFLMMRKFSINVPQVLPFWGRKE